MTARTTAPLGMPCWADLWTSDVEGARRFYAELFGWEPLEPSAEFGGYFMFARDGAPVCGGMGDMGDMRANDRWKVYLCTDDAGRTAAEVAKRGGAVIGEVGAVADLGSQVVFTDPAGAALGAWQPGTFQGFSALGEPGAPSWFELMTDDYEGSMAFYKGVFGWSHSMVGDTDDFRYAVVEDAAGGQYAGVMDAARHLPPGEGAQWFVYWGVEEVERTGAEVVRLGGSVREGPMDTPYGRMIFAVDPMGAYFNLHQPNE